MSYLISNLKGNFEKGISSLFITCAGFIAANFSFFRGDVAVDSLVRHYRNQIISFLEVNCKSNITLLGIKIPTTYLHDNIVTE